ncbi:MAG: hypothetical protein POH28_12285, partial [Acidocella sp.]|nr:hypothetical protein [Acidocella sp.]
MQPESLNPTLPAPADMAAAARLRADFAALGKAEQRFAQSQMGAAMLDCLGGNAPYLADLACREPQSLVDTMATG